MRTKFCNILYNLGTLGLQEAFCLCSGEALRIQICKYAVMHNNAPAQVGSLYSLSSQETSSMSM